MNDNTAVWERITADAQKEAKELVDSAKKRINSSLETFKAELAQNEEEEVSRAKATTARENELLALSDKTTERKELLAKKHEIVDEVFAMVRKELLANKDNKKLIDALTKKYAREGDKIEKANGGIIISNKTYDLKLTADELLAGLREEIEVEVAEILFGVK
jgi:vacuolar-type H+-ATPase subunit E/Vma4